jgi:hypothetical protein
MPQLPDGTYPRAKGGPVNKDASLLFNEELRHFSNNIAKDCDDAFRSSLIEDDSFSGSLTDVERKQRDSTPFSFTIDTPSEATAPTEFSSMSWSSRPLPPLPLDTGFKSQQTTAVNSRPVSRAGDRNTLADQVNLLALPMLLSNQQDRRVVSAPYGQASRRTGTLPCISENPGGGNTTNAEKTRIVSAPPHTPSKKVNRPISGVEYLNQVENSIRVVTSPAAQSPVKIPEPLNVRKKLTKVDLGRPFYHHLEQPENMTRNHERHEQDGLQPNLHSPVKKKKSWFKRSFKLDSDETLVESKDEKQRTVSCETHQSSSTSTTAASSKKRNFSFPFWKSNRNRDSKMIIEGKGDYRFFYFFIETF